MKRLIITLSVMGCLLADPSPVGYWKLSGLKVDYLHISRGNAATPIVLTDVYGAGVAVTVSEVPAGIVYSRFTNGPFTIDIIDAAQLNLNVNIYPGGTGSIAEGSFYPDIDLIPGTCITSPQIFPVTDTFTWATGDETTYGVTNILGIPGLNDLAGSQAYGFGIQESSTFDGWPFNPTPEPIPPVVPYIAMPDGTLLSASCQTAVVMSGACDPYMAYGEEAYYQCVGETAAYCASMPYPNNESIGSPFGGAGWLHGSGSSGTFNLDQGNSQMGQDINVDFLLEWNAIDGPSSGSGFGDDPDVDEDGDGTAYDRIFGIPYITATYIDDANPLCDITTGALTGAGPGLSYPVAGDVVDALGGEAAVGALITGLCLEGTTAQVDAMCQAAGGPTEFVYGSCLAGVEDAVEGQCLAADLDGDGVGTPVEAVTGLCVEASQGDDFAAGCAYYGPAASVTAACLALGFDDETCAAAGAQGAGAVDAYCDSLSGVPGLGCVGAGIDPCAILTDITFATGLCGVLAGSLVTSETCDEWAASFDDDFLNEQALAVLGATCTDYAAATTGLPWGAPEYCGAFAAGAADQAFAQQTGLTCTEYGASYTAMCITSVGTANDMYLMDPSLTTWGMFLTYNGASVQQYLAAGYTLEDIATYFPELLVNDSTHDFDPTCYYTGETCSGRLVMHFEPTCVPELEARQIVAEFVNLDELCEASGDVNGDGTTNVVDVVRMVTHVLGGDQLGGVGFCEGNLNGDDVINVVDIVTIVNIILNGSVDTSDSASSATIKYTDNKISVESDGYVQGVQLTISHCDDFSLELNDAYISDYSTTNNETTLLMVSQGATADQNISEIAKVSSSCDFTITDVVVSGRVGEYDTTIEEVQSKGFTVKPAYPNPFNPTTNLNLVLENDAQVSVQIYNIAGQLVDVIADGLYNLGSYNWTWNAENLASGVYFVKTQVGSEVHTDKIMLLK